MGILYYRVQGDKAKYFETVVFLMPSLCCLGKVSQIHRIEFLSWA